MKYRAVAVGLLQDGRALQTFSVSEDSVRRWAEATAAAHQCPVAIYISEERLLDTVPAPGAA